MVINADLWLLIQQRLWTEDWYGSGGTCWCQ